MKRFFALILIITVAISSAYSQTSNSTAQEQRQQARGLKVKDKQLENKIKEKALSDARKEAKRLAKEGFTVAVGALPLDKQIEQAWKYQYDTDENGNRLYIMATQKATAGNYTAAKTQVNAAAKVELAGQIATEVEALIQQQVNNQELEADDAATLISTVSASKQKIQQKLGRIIPVVEISRTLPNKNVEMQITIAYNTQNALSIVKQTLNEELKTKSDKLSNQLDRIIK